MSNFSQITILKGFIFFLLIVTFINRPTVLAAHRYHTSLTRMDYNTESKSVEISIQLFTHDLIDVLETKHRQKIDLEKTAGINKLILAYLEQNFILKNSQGKPGKLRWIGKESTVDVIWLYLEIRFEEGLDGKSLQNSIFFETFAEQTNLVICRYGQKKADLLFKVGDKIKEIQVLGVEN